MGQVATPGPFFLELGYTKAVASYRIRIFIDVGRYYDGIFGKINTHFFQFINNDWFLGETSASKKAV